MIKKENLFVLAFSISVAVAIVAAKVWHDRELAIAYHSGAVQVANALKKFPECASHLQIEGDKSSKTPIKKK